MGPWGAAALSFGADVVGGLFSANQASKNRKWQERMSNTAYQRATKDMIKAGLNPMLAGLNQQGASTPSGNVPEIPFGAGARAASAVQTAKMNAAQIENIEANTETAKAQADKTRAEATMLEHRVPWSSEAAWMENQRMHQQVETAAQELKNIVQQYDLTAEDIRNKKLTNEQLAKMQPLLERLAELEVQAGELAVPGLRNIADFEEFIGRDVGMGAQLAKTIIEIIRAMDQQSAPARRR